MRRLFAGLFLLALACGTARIASAVQWPPGPMGATCNDTLSLIDVQDPNAACGSPVGPAGSAHPASGDTVWGVRGIVTAFDAIPSAFNVWIELSSGAAYSGADVFTGATNYNALVPWPGGGGTLALGDQVVVYGRALEFNDVTEVTDFDNIQSTNDIIIRRLSTGNALPPFHVDTVHNLNWVPSLSAATAEPWEGCLVKIRGPMTVGRNAGPGIGGNSFLVTCASCGTDSAAVDGFSLTTTPAPTVGTVVDSVQGIFTQVTINSIASYRILLRSSDDLFAALPPSVTDEYPLEDNIIRIVFDRPVQAASATDPNNYTLDSTFGPADAAVLEPGSRAVDLTITNGLQHGDLEGVTVQNVVSASGIPMPANQHRSFINGVLSLKEIQQPDPAGLANAPCYDRSRFTSATGGLGTRLTFRGIDVFSDGALSFLTDPVAGQRTGLAIFGSIGPLTSGHQYEMAGQVEEFNGISTTIQAGATEAQTFVFQKDEGVKPIPAPQIQTIHVLTDTTCDASQTHLNGEDFEGVYIKVQHGQVITNDVAGASFFIRYPFEAVGPGPGAPPPADTLEVLGLAGFTPDSLDVVDVVGAMNWRNNGTLRDFRLDPQTITRLSSGVGSQPDAKLSFAVSNPSRNPRVTFTLTHKDVVDVGVYDLAGRRLATLIHGEAPAGEFSKVWDGRDQRGQLVRSGMYFYRLNAGGRVLKTQAVKLN